MPARILSVQLFFLKSPLLVRADAYQLLGMLSSYLFFLRCEYFPWVYWPIKSFIILWGCCYDGFADNKLLRLPTATEGVLCMGRTFLHVVGFGIDMLLGAHCVCLTYVYKNEEYQANTKSGIIWIWWACYYILVSSRPDEWETRCRRMRIKPYWR